MKKYLIAITLMLALGLNAQAASQKHRHTSRTEQVDSTKNNQDAIEAFSDTTSTADADDAEDDKYISHRHRSIVYGGNEDLKEVMDGVGGIRLKGFLELDRDGLATQLDIRFGRQWRRDEHLLRGVVKGDVLVEGKLDLLAVEMRVTVGRHRLGNHRARRVLGPARRGDHGGTG